MAIAAGTIFQVMAGSTAANANGCGFNPGNANGISDGVIASGTGNSPTLSSATYSFVAGDVNHWIYFKTQSNINPGFYQITSVNAGVATLNAAVGAASVPYGMSYTPNTVAGCATTSSPTGVTFLVDYSQSTSSRYNATDLASTIGTTNPSTVTSATNPFTAQMVGNLIHITAGTSWTQGWYEIVSVSGSTATLDRAVGSVASLSGGTYRTGGAASLNSSTTNQTDTNFFALSTNAATAGSKWFIQGSNSYTIAGTPTTLAGNAQYFSLVEGYATVRGDKPTGSTRPTLNAGANNFTLANLCTLRNVIFTATTAAGLSAASANQEIIDCKFVNTSTTTDRAALTLGTTTGKTLVLRCEAVSYCGFAIAIANSSTGARIIGCYLHDSVIGVKMGSSSSFVMEDTIIESCTTYGVRANSSTSLGMNINNCTFYGTEAKRGTAIDFTFNTVTNVSWTITNNIFYGFVTGIAGYSQASYSGTEDFNNFYNNTTDVSNWTKGSSDVAYNPSFTSVAQSSGSTATTTSGNHLVDSGATFQTSGVVAGRDYLNVISGTGVTAQIYGIASVDSETQITTDLTLTANATADKVYTITRGHNFSFGNPSLKGTATPSRFPAALTTGYKDVGAVQCVSPNFPVIGTGSQVIRGN